MFAVIYRGYVKPNKEKEYRQLWHQIATYFVEKRGALGSCLHKTKEGLWLAYSRWPDKKRAMLLGQAKMRLVKRYRIIFDKPLCKLKSASTKNGSSLKLVWKWWMIY